jgi:hypothetical protein
MSIKVYSHKGRLSSLPGNGYLLGTVSFDKLTDVILQNFV